MSNSRSRIPSPARSQGAPKTPRRYVTPRKSRSVCSPGRTNAPVRLSTLIQEHKEQEKSSFLLSPIVRKSLLPDDTDIEAPGRKSWWKNLNDQSRDVMEVLKENVIEPHNIMEELNIEVFSQEDKKRYTLDLPDSSDCESIHSIVIPNKRLFYQKENRPLRQFDQFGNRKTLDKVFQSNTNEKTTTTATKDLFHSKPVSRPAFPAALLDVSANTTVGDKTLAPAIKPKTGLRIMFGAQQATKRKNMFAKFIESTDYSSEEEIADVSGVQKRFFDLPKPGPQRRASARSSSSKFRDPSPSSHGMADSFADWDHLPSSTMVDIQLEAALTGGNKAKRSKLSELPEASSPSTSNSTKSGNKSKQSNKSTTLKNKSQINDKSLQKIYDVPQNISPDLNPKETRQINTSKTNKNLQNSITKVTLLEKSPKNNKSKTILKETIEMDVDLEQNMSMEKQQDDQELEQEKNLTEQGMNKNQTKILDKSPHKVIEKSAEISSKNNEINISTDQNVVINDDVEMRVDVGNNKSLANSLQQNQKINQITTVTSAQIQEKEHNTDVDIGQKAMEKHDGQKSEACELQTEKEENKCQDINFQIDLNKSQDQNNSVINVEATQQQLGLDQDIETKPNDLHKEQNEILNDEHINKEKQSEIQEVNISINEENQNKSQENQNISQEIEEDQDAEENKSQEEIEVDESEAENEELEQHSEVDPEVENKSEIEEQEVDENEEIEYESEVEEQAVDENEKEIEEQDEEIGDEVDNQNEEDPCEVKNQESEQKAANQSIETTADSEPENDQEEEANESEHESENESKEESENEQVNESTQESENEHVNKTEDEINESEHISENEQENESDNEQQNESERESENEQQNEYDQQVETDQNDEAIDNTLTPDISHDTTGRNRKKPDNVSIEAVVFRPTKELEHSFVGRGRNTTVKKSKSLINPHIEPEKIQENNTRGSLSMSEGKNSSAEGSGWDSHRTTRKTLRQTFGKDFTPRKSLRALVMEKSAKRHTMAKGNKDVTSGNIPLANSTELGEASMGHDYEMQEESVESVHEVSLRTRKATLEDYLIKINKKNEEKRTKMAEEVKKYLERPKQPNLFKVPARPTFQRGSQPKAKDKTKVPANIRGKLSVPLEELPTYFQEDLQYKPPKRFAPRNAAWLTKRFYKFVESKLQPKYDYKARLRAEKFAQTLHSFVQGMRRRDVALPESVDELKHEMARLKIVTTHFEFYDFFWDYMPREVRVKVIPDLTNKIPHPRSGIFSDILEPDIRG